MDFEINSFYDLGRYWGIKEGEERGEQRGEQRGEERGEQRGEQRGIRDMLKRCIDIRFPLMSQATLNNILTISDVDVLKSIFNVACASESLDNFQRDVRRIIPAN